MISLDISHQIFWIFGRPMELTSSYCSKTHQNLHTYARIPLYKRDSDDLPRFKTAYQKSFEIENLKRSAREIKFKILKVIYEKPEEKSLRVYLTSKIFIKLFDMIVRAEEISDFLRSLIVKYPSK